MLYASVFKLGITHQRLSSSSLPPLSLFSPFSHDGSPILLPQPFQVGERHLQAQRMETWWPIGSWTVGEYTPELLAFPFLSLLLSWDSVQL